MPAQLEDDNKKALAGLIATNTAVFALWRVSFGRPALERLMWRHFACSYTAIAHGKRLHTLLTSAFSHITVPHFAINMFMLWEFGRHILAPANRHDAWYERAVAKSRVVEYFRATGSSVSASRLQLDKFLALYFGSAVASSALSVVVSNLRRTPGGSWVEMVNVEAPSVGIGADDFCRCCSLHHRREWRGHGRVHRLLPAVPRARGAHLLE